MADLAFYAPLKAPDHPTPSGDRQMARALLLALVGRAAPVSRLRLYDGAGDAAVQRDLRAQAKAETARLIAGARGRGGAGRAWSAWITYHSYYKAPDLLGPQVSRALGIPYVLIEATRAKKRLTGPWADFAALAEAAADQARLILYLTERDGVALRRDAPPGQRIHRLPPFLPIEALPEAPAPPRHPAGAPVILCVAMLRPGDKAASFRIVAEVLARLQTPDWRLHIAGEGPERAAIEAYFQPFGPRVRFLGQLDRIALRREYEGADLLLWPGVNEAYGLSYLEAQAAGLPVVAQDRPGVRDVVLRESLVPVEGGEAALAGAVDALLAEPDLRRARAREGRAKVAGQHLLGPARALLLSQIDAVIGAAMEARR